MSSAAPPDPAALAAIIAEIRNIYVTAFAGFVIGTALYGVTFLQYLYYVRTFAKDSWLLKLFTLFLFILDTLSTTFVAHSIGWWWIDNLGNPLAGIIEPWSFRVENGILTVITVAVQCYFARQIWILSRNKIAVLVVVFLSLTAFGLGVTMTALVSIHPVATYLIERTPRIIGGLVQGFAALCDIVITGYLCYTLHIRRSGVPKTERLVDRLILIVINRGLLTTVAQTCFLLLYTPIPNHTYWLPFHQALGKLYVNSYLAMLNIRGSNRGTYSDPTLNDKMVFRTPNTTSGYSGTLEIRSKDVGLKVPQVDTLELAEFDSNRRSSLSA